MKNSLFVMMIVAVSAFATSANAAEKYVQSVGNSVFTIDRDAGTITRQIRSSIQGTPVQSETLSCKYGYIVTVIGDATAMLDLLAPLNSGQANDAALKRLEGARKDCQLYTIEPRF